MTTKLIPGMRGALEAHEATGVGYSNALLKKEEELIELRESRKRVLQLHHVGWEELFSAELAARGLTWCTLCLEVAPSAETRLVLIKDVRKVSCGHEGGDWCWQDHGGLHRSCGACYSKAKARHGWLGELSWDRTAQEKYLVYDVHEENGTYSYDGQSLGKWRRLPVFGDISRGRSNAQARTNLAVACEMPPELYIDSSGNLQIVTYEKPAEAGATA